MTVRVHLQSETGSWSEESGTFTCEEYYEVCITALETWAKKKNNIITERYITQYVELSYPPEYDKTRKIMKIAKYVQHTNLVYIAQDFENLADMILNEDRDGYKKH